MIITLKGANFSASNIGQLDSWFITKDFGSGVNYSGPTSVKKNAALNATITISSGYELDGSVSVTMGGNPVTSEVTTGGNPITISITSVTGGITIKVPTKSTAGGGGGGGNEEPETPVTPDVPSGETVWYIQSLKQIQEANKMDVEMTELTAAGSYAWAFNTLNSKLENRTINTIEMIPFYPGKFSIGVYNPTTYTVEESRELEFTDTDLNTTRTYTFNDLTIPSNKYFVWNCQGRSSGTGEGLGFYVFSKDAPEVEDHGTWYQAYYDTGLKIFQSSSPFDLIFVANIGYTAP